MPQSCTDQPIALRASQRTLTATYDIQNTTKVKEPALSYTGPRSAVGNVFGYRCVSDCRSRGREFDPGPVPYFRGD